MSSLLFHDLFYRSKLQSWLLFLLSPLVGLLANLLRVVGIVLNPYSKFAAVHTAQGLVMIAAAVVLLAMLDGLLTRLIPAPAPGRRLRIVSTTPLAPGRAAGLAALFGALALASLVLRPWPQPPIHETALSEFPLAFEGWQSEGLKLDREFYGSTTFSEWVNRRYAKDGQSVEVLLGSDRRLDPFESPVSLKSAVPGSGYRIEQREPITLPSGRPAERLIVREADREVIYRWYVDVEPAPREIARALVSLDRGPFRRPGRALVVRIRTIADGEADERLRQFAQWTEAAIAAKFPDIRDR
jgi:exosortase/archaeosortase family protein